MFKKLLKFLQDKSGNFALIAAIAAPAMIGMAGLATDYVSIFNYREEMQEAADGAALASVRELMLAGNTDGHIQSIAENFATANTTVGKAGEDIKVTTIVDRATNEVTVEVAYSWTPMFAHFFDRSATPVIKRSKAKLAGSGLTCIIGMMEPQRQAKASIHLDNRSKIVADGCSIYSNSTDRFGMRVDSNAKMSAASICSAGGVLSLFRTSISPEPLRDCPKAPDPLEARFAPPIGPCTETDLVIETNTILRPGTYCGGITIRGNATVQLDRGIFIIKDGPLIVTDTASLIAGQSSFYLTGDGSTFSFDSDTTIDLSAMTTGSLAGLLFFEDRNVPHSFDFNPLRLDQIPEEVRVHRITSNNARRLIGTLYLKNSILLIDADAPVSDASAYTALVVGRLWLRAGPVLHLNADYTQTNVPVPGGLIGQKPMLVQ